MTISHDILRLKLAESLTAPLPVVTRRDVRQPAVPNKALAVIGVRRGGKTSFLYQCMADRIREGIARERQLFLSLEDERLIGIEVGDLTWILEEHRRQHPPSSSNDKLTLYLDEVQLVPGWETLVRRLMDGGQTDVFVSGSSAKLLSREVATSLRGRALEILVHPFSFREALRHSGVEPSTPYDRLSPTERAELDRRLRAFLSEGGFPEAQGIDGRDRVALLSGYVDVLVLRDIIERHEVRNPTALRWIQRQLLANPGGAFSVKKHYETLRSQGIPVGKDTLHDYLGYLEDAFLIRTIEMESDSERQRMVNLRKAYPIDNGLIALYERTGRVQQGRSLETEVLLELERRGYKVTYVRVHEGRSQETGEVDFFAQRIGEQPLLIQVCIDTSAELTMQRELSALIQAGKRFSSARMLLITLDGSSPTLPPNTGVSWFPAAQWLLEGQ